MDDLAIIAEKERLKEALAKLPILQLGPAKTNLFAYRISPFGIFFVEATEKAESSGNVHFVTSGIILKAAGDNFRDDEVAKLLAENAINNVLEVSTAGLVAC